MQGEACGRLLSEGRMGPLGVVVGHPGRDQIAGMGEVAEQGLVQKCVPHPAVEAFDETGSRMGLPGAMSCHSILISAHHFKMAFEVSSVPLSLTIIPGFPRRSIARSTRVPHVGPRLGCRGSR